MPGRLTTTRVATNVERPAASGSTSAPTSDGGTHHRAAAAASRSTRTSRRPSRSPSRRRRTGPSSSARCTSRRNRQRAAAPAGGVRAARRARSTLRPGVLAARRSRGAAPATCTVTAQQQQLRATRPSTSTPAPTNDLRIIGTEGAAHRSTTAHAELHDVALAGAAAGRAVGRSGREPCGYLPARRASASRPIPIGDEEIVNFDLADAAARRSPASPGTGSASTPTATWCSAGAPPRTTTAATCPPGPIRPGPNNVLAPFWTDLDGTGADGILVGFLGTGHRRVARRRVPGQRVRDRRPAHVPGLDRRRLGVRRRRRRGHQLRLRRAAGRPRRPGLPRRAPRTSSARATWRPCCPPATSWSRARTSSRATRCPTRCGCRGSSPGIRTVTSSMKADIVPGTSIVSTDVRVLQSQQAPVERN